MKTIDSVVKNILLGLHLSDECLPNVAFVEQEINSLIVELENRYRKEAKNLISGLITELICNKIPIEQADKRRYLTDIELKYSWVFNLFKNLNDNKNDNKSDDPKLQRIMEDLVIQSNSNEKLAYLFDSECLRIATTVKELMKYLEKKGMIEALPTPTEITQ